MKFSKRKMMAIVAATTVALAPMTAKADGRNGIDYVQIERYRRMMHFFEQDCSRYFRLSLIESDNYKNVRKFIYANSACRGQLIAIPYTIRDSYGTVTEWDFRYYEKDDWKRFKIEHRQEVEQWERRGCVCNFEAFFMLMRIKEGQLAEARLKEEIETSRRMAERAQVAERQLELERKKSRRAAEELEEEIEASRRMAERAQVAERQLELERDKSRKVAEKLEEEIETSRRMAERAEVAEIQLKLERDKSRRAAEELEKERMTKAQEIEKSKQRELGLEAELQFEKSAKIRQMERYNKLHDEILVNAEMRLAREKVSKTQDKMKKLEKKEQEIQDKARKLEKQGQKIQNRVKRLKKRKQKTQDKLENARKRGQRAQELFKDAQEMAEEAETAEPSAKRARH